MYRQQLEILIAFDRSISTDFSLKKRLSHAELRTSDQTRNSLQSTAAVGDSWVILSMHQ